MTDERQVAIAPACERLGDLAAASAPGSSGAPDARQWASIESRLATADRPSRWPGVRRRWPILAATSVVLACAVGWLAARRTLSYRTEACAVSADGSLRSVDKGVVAFDDGTRIDLEPSSRMRIKPLAFARGAELFLDDGQVKLAVVHRPNARWAVVAGPFRVQVTGTRFSVGWSNRSGRLRIVMADGEVRVSGGPVQADTRLRAGQALVAEAGHFVVQDVATAPPAPKVPVAEPAAEPPAAEDAPPTLRKVAAPRRAAGSKLAAPGARQDERALPATVENVAPPAPLPPAPSPPPATAPPPAPSLSRAGPARVSIAADGQLSGGVTGFAWVEGGEGTELSIPVPRQERTRLHTTDGQLCAHGRLARWACVNEGTPHIRCNWDRNWGVAIGFFVTGDRTAWGAQAASAISIDFRGRSTAYRLVAHHKGDPPEKVYCLERYKSGQPIKPGQLKSRCWDDAGDTLPDFRDVEYFSLQALSGLKYVAFRYCITGITVYP